MQEVILKKKTYSWELKLSAGTTYDNNILKYSDKYIDRFINLEDEGRFHISSYDDMVIPYSVGLIYSNRFIGKLKTTLSAEYSSNSYANNGIKNWEQYDIYLRQSITKSISVYLSYSYIPDFYIRHFRDDDWVEQVGYTPEAFTPYAFSKDDISTWIQYNFSWKTTKLRTYFSYMRYFHNKHYTEYDSDNYLYGFRIYQSVTKKLSVDAGYRYVTSDAKAIDEANDFDEAAVATRGDATYLEHTYIFGADYTLPKVFKLKNDVGITVQFIRRIYTTDHFLELDPIHAGRDDKSIRIYSSYNLQVFKNFSVSAFLNWIYRDSETLAEENREYLSDEKDYTQYQFGIKFRYNIKF